MSGKLNKHTILVVDDTPGNIKLLVEILQSEYKIKVATNGRTALEIVQVSPQPDLILLDIMMTGIDGYETCRQVKSNELTKNIPIIFITALIDTGSEEKGLELGAADYIGKPFNPSLVRARVQNHIKLKLYQDGLEELVKERTRELEQIKQVTLTAMASLAECRDPETGEHIIRTQEYVKAIAEHLHDHPRFEDYINQNSVNLIHKSAPLHDIGKVAIPDRILLKPAKLTEEEFKEMKQHTIYGRDALLKAGKLQGKSSFLKIAGEIAISHHEKWDGSGYPYGLKGDDIPIIGRIMAIADVYDALISKRSYKEAYSHEKSLGIIIKGKGTHFDPDIVTAFLEIEEQVKLIAHENSDQK